MSDKDKVKKAVKLFDQIKALLPNNSVSMSIHSLHRSDLPKEFIPEIHDHTGDLLGGTKYMSAKRNDEAFDIVLFGDVYED